MADTKSLLNIYYQAHSIIPACAGIQRWRGRFVAIISFLHTPVRGVISSAALVFLVLLESEGSGHPDIAVKFGASRD